MLKGGMFVCWAYAALLAMMLWMMPVIEQMAAAEKGRASLAAGFPGAVPMPVGAGFLDETRAFIIPLLVLSIVVAYGLAKDRHWSRWMMMALLIIGVVTLPLAPELASGPMYAGSIALAAFGWWYLYRKPNVVGYYAAIRERSGRD